MTDGIASERVTSIDSQRRIECHLEASGPDASMPGPEGAQASAGVEAAVDPLEAKKAAEEAEEQRLAELRRLGTPVTPATFAPWKQRFYAALGAAAERKRCALRIVVMCRRRRLPCLPSMAWQGRAEQGRATSALSGQQAASG